MRLKDKVAIVTGGGQGIGKAIALGLAAEGAAVVIGQRHADRAEAVAKEIEASGGKALGMSLDVTSMEAPLAVHSCSLSDQYHGMLCTLERNSAHPST